jgi:hypothetical protein
MTNKSDDVKHDEEAALRTARRLEPVIVKPSWYWVKDSRGNASVSTTLVWVAFWVTTIAYISSIVEAIGPVTFRQFDVAACSSYFGALLVLYFGRRFTETKYSSGEKK